MNTNRLSIAEGVTAAPPSQKGGEKGVGNRSATHPATSGAPPSPVGPAAFSLESFSKWVVSFFSSLRLTVICLVLGLLLVFLGTLAQVDMGLYKAQNEFFRSFIVFWGPKTAHWKIPVFPGGYLVGGVLLVNLVTAHFMRFKWSRAKAGIWMVHFGLILLLLGQLLTDMLSRESILHLREGQAKNYSEASRQAELAVIDTTKPDLNTVVAIPDGALKPGKEIRNPELPFTVKVKSFYVNSSVEELGTNSTAAASTQGIGQRAIVRDLPRVTEMDVRDVPSAVVEIATSQGSMGTWLVSEFVNGEQSFTFNQHTYQLALRPRRYYQPFSLQLLEFRHDIYPGTDIPRNFSSRVVLQRPDTGENREVLIYMNNPLRYSGETFYQADFDKDNHGTVLQVVRNPSWLTPYFSCVLVGLGLVVQFGSHLLGFTLKRKAA